MIEKAATLTEWKQKRRVGNYLQIKLTGTLQQIENHILLLKRIYNNEYLIFSPIIKNVDHNDNDKFHCFIDILPSTVNNAPIHDSRSGESKDANASL